MATEKLLELLQSDDCPLILCYGGMERLVNYLIANGVTIPVRCKDCEHFDERYRNVYEETGRVYCGGYCYHWDYEQGMSPNEVDGDDFCSYGERRTDA